MNKKLVTAIMSVLIVGSALGLGFGMAQMGFRSQGALIVDWRGPPYGNYVRIQEAVDASNNGDTIWVRWGSGVTYTERVNVTKSIAIRGFEGKPVVNGGGKGAVFNVTASDVTLFNLEIRNGSYGIKLFYSATRSNITNNFVTSNVQTGIYANSENSTIKGNMVTANGYGIAIHASGNLLRNNNMTNNGYNFRITNFIRNDIDTSNTVNQKPVYIWVDEHYKQVPLDAGYIAVVSSSNITVKNLKLSNNDCGIQFINTSNSTIENVTVSKNLDGVYLSGATGIAIRNVNASYNALGIDFDLSNSSLIRDSIVSSNDIVGIDFSVSKDNMITGNTIKNNGLTLGGATGILIYIGTRNRFYHNNIKNNKATQVTLVDSYDYWDNGEEGNYWSDHTGVDSDGDGILDSPRQVDNWNTDWRPLAKPWKQIRVFNVGKTSGGKFKGYNMTIRSDNVIASENFTRIDIGKIYPRQFSFNITAGTAGVVNVTIPRAWLDGPFTISVDNMEPSFQQVSQNATHSSLYFTYTTGKHKVKIEGIKAGAVFGDFNGDGRIDIKDLAMVAKNYGDNYAPSLPTDVTQYDP